MINNIQFLIQRHNQNNALDISELIESIEWKTDIRDNQAGQLKFSYVETGRASIANYGDRIRFRFGGIGVFFGRVFEKRRNETGIIEVTAFDNMRLLKNEHTFVFPATTSTRIFRRICRAFEIPHRVRHSSRFNVPARVGDNETLFDMLQNAFDLTLTHTSQWFFVRDNFGVLEHVNIMNLRTNLFIGDDSLATGFEFKGSINEDTFNRIRLVRENKETKRREVYIVQSGRNISRWGLLQYHETVDENLNPAQIAERADLLLRVKNRATRDLKISAIGDLRVRAGNGVVLGIRALRNEGFRNLQNVLVCGCTHKWGSEGHVMDLDITLPN